MSKYNPLSERLSAHAGDEWGVTFSELESVLGFPLPKSARTNRAWWTNAPDKAHSRAWAAHGWTVGDIDHAAERVVFRKGAASGAVLVEAAHLQPLADADHAAGPVLAEPPPQPEPPSAPPSEPDTAAEVQPPVMREAAETASSQMHATRKRGQTAMLAVTAALGTVVIRRLFRRKK